jgi:hypothetical protein
MRQALPALLLAATTMACGGEGGSSPPPTQTPPGNTLQNPCPVQEIADTPAAPSPGEIAANRGGAPSKDSTSFDGSTRWRVLEDLWINRQAEARLTPGRRDESGPPVKRIDVGSIAVLQDEGDLIVPPNPWDLRSIGLRFTVNAAGGYDVRLTDGSFRQTLGTRLTLVDDDTEQVAVPFAFNFYGRRQTAAFVNSDGNITFGEGDTATNERNVARLLSGPPRVAPFLADLDPSR